MPTKLEDHLAELEEKEPSKTFEVNLDGAVKLDNNNSSENVRLVPRQVEMEEGKQEQPRDDKGRFATREEATEDDPAVALEAMKKQIADANTARERAEAAAREAVNQSRRAAEQQRQAEEQARRAAEEALRSRTVAAEADYNRIINGISSAEQSKKSLEGQYASLIAEGKWVEASQVNSELARVNAHLVFLEDGKAAAEAKKNQPRQEQQTQTTQTNNQSTEDAWLAQQDPYNAAWIRQHRDKFFNDASFANKAVAASAYAINVLGLKAGTPEYYSQIDQAVGLAQKPEATTTEPPSQARTESKTSAAATTQSRSSPTVTAAPPSRTTPGSPANGRQTITLTAAERAHARATLTKDIIGNRDPEVVFAEHKARMIADGRWGNNNS